MTCTKIVAVRATTGGFQFQKQIWILSYNFPQNENQQKFIKKELCTLKTTSRNCSGLISFLNKNLE
jgi:hypothetical protein